MKVDEQGRSLCYLDVFLFQRSIDPKHIDRASVYLASDYFLSQTTGTVLKIDAGTTLNNYFARMFSSGTLQRGSRRS